MAVESAKVTSVIVEASEYPDLVQKYQVSSVPKTMVNETVEILAQGRKRTSSARPLARSRRRSRRSYRASATNITRDFSLDT